MSVLSSLDKYIVNHNQVIPMAFLTMINGAGGQPEINFANAGNNCSSSTFSIQARDLPTSGTTFAGTQLLDCPQIA